MTRRTQAYIVEANVVNSAWAKFLNGDSQSNLL